MGAVRTHTKAWLWKSKWDIWDEIWGNGSRNAPQLHDVSRCFATEWNGWKITSIIEADKKIILNLLRMVMVFKTNPMFLWQPSESKRGSLPLWKWAHLPRSGEISVVQTTGQNLTQIIHKKSKTILLVSQRVLNMILLSVWQPWLWFALPNYNSMGDHHMPQGDALFNILIRGLAFITASYKVSQRITLLLTDWN